MLFAWLAILTIVDVGLVLFALALRAYLVDIVAQRLARLERSHSHEIIDGEDVTAGYNPLGLPLEDPLLKDVGPLPWFRR